MRHLKLMQFRKVRFLHCSSTQNCCPVAMWGCCITISEQSPGVESVNTKICTRNWVLGWIWVFLSPALVHSCGFGAAQPNTVRVCDSASVVMSCIIHVRIWRDQLGNLIIPSVYRSVTINLGCEMGLQLDFAVKNCKNGCVSSLQMGWEAENKNFWEEGV